MQPIAQIFNLAAIVCELTYDSGFVSLALIGLGHEKTSRVSRLAIFYFPTSWQRLLIKSSTLMGADILWLPALN